jgi:DNA-binding response OmpR family regulator/DNA-binding CsgD family transcriptional regulator
MEEVMLPTVQNSFITDRKVVLIVDDEPANLRLLWMYLDQANFKVLAARDGTRALQIAGSTQPDIILLDVMMPGLDGFETCRQLKLNPLTYPIPVIFMTALSETTEKVRGFDVGGVDYITKPAEPAEVLARVRMHLTLQSMQRQLQAQVETCATQLQERTAELMVTNAQLRVEVQQQQVHNTERERLLELIRHQNEYLQMVSGQLAQQQQAHYANLEHALYEHVLPMLTQLSEQLETLRQHIITPHSAPTVLLSAVSTARRILGQLQAQVHNLTQDVPVTPAKPIYPLNEPSLKLSPRELEVFELLVQGLSPSEIGVMLNISDKTVYKHRTAVLEKLNVQSIPELVKLALQRQLLH